MKCRGGARIWVVGGWLGWGKLGFGSWVNAIKRCARGGGFGLKIENRAVGARISRTKCGGARIWIVGGMLGWGKPGFGSWVNAIKRCERGGGVG